jgi:RecB family exonuclease
VTFAVPLSRTLLVGKIDLLARHGDRAVIVDYKTGHAGAGPLDPARFEGQARCYALAALAAGAGEVELRFVALERLIDGRPEEVVFTYRASDAEALRRELDARVEAMSATPLPPLPEYDPHACAGCAAAGTICAVGRPPGFSARSPRTPV